MWRREIEFEIQEMLGEGGQGRVFKALRRDRASGLSQQVALKILHSKTAVELWKKEFASLARVRSPFCVQVLSFERVRGRPALVLELVDGVTLPELGPLNAEALDEITAQIQRGLLDLRAQGTFHGDLSPHNVMLDSRGHVRLLDFGLANASPRLTPGFAAPERLNGAAASFHADLYSLGRIEEFLHGRRLHSPLLAQVPEERSLRALKSRRQHRRLLAAAVTAILNRRQQSALLATRTHGNLGVPKARTRSPRGLQRFLPLNKAALLALITWALTLTVSGASQTAREETAVLSIRTRAWHYFTMDGVPAGYAPLSLQLRADHTHQLEWTSPQGRGRREIRLPRGSHVWWSDRDFSH